MTQSSPALEQFRTFRAGEVLRGENMLYSGADPELYIAEYTLLYEDNIPRSVPDRVYFSI